jgi:hypothetical protein
MISLTVPLLKTIVSEKASLMDTSGTAEPDVDTASVESSSSSSSNTTTQPRTCPPYVPPPSVDRTTIFLIGIVLFFMVRICPAIILIGTIVCAVSIPYIFRINDDVTVRRQLYAQFCRENSDHLPDRFRNIQNYVNLDESYWTNDRYVC